MVAVTEEEVVVVEAATGVINKPKRKDVYFTITETLLLLFIIKSC